MLEDIESLDDLIMWKMESCGVIMLQQVLDLRYGTTAGDYVAKIYA
jgi:hypothetical protein